MSTHTHILDQRGGHSLAGAADLLVLVLEVHIPYLVHPFLLAGHTRLFLEGVVAPALLCHDSVVARLRLWGPRNSLAVADIHFLFLRSRRIHPHHYSPAHIHCHIHRTQRLVGIAHSLAVGTAAVAADSLVVVEISEQSRCKASAAEGSKMGRMPY